jgi:hypothetical protein
MTFQNIHLVDLQYNSASPVTPPSKGTMDRPALTSVYCDLSNSSYTGSLPYWFGWPLGSQIKLGGTPVPQYTFRMAVEFDPQGSARFIVNSISTTYPDAIAPYLEIGLQTAHGGGAAAVNGATGEIAAIQINGITGAVHIYRP